MDWLMSPTREEYVFAPDQIDELILLLVDVLEFIQHDLAELGANAALYIGTGAQKPDSAAFEVVEIECANGGFAFVVELFETGENVEDHSAKRGRLPVDCPGFESFAELVHFGPSIGRDVAEIQFPSGQQGKGSLEFSSLSASSNSSERVDFLSA